MTTKDKEPTKPESDVAPDVERPMPMDPTPCSTCGEPTKPHVHAAKKEDK